MPNWNMYSEEVREERRLVRAYGRAKINNRLPVADTYKGQALRELALRLEAEEEFRGVAEQLAELDNLRDEVAYLKDKIARLESGAVAAK